MIRPKKISVNNQETLTIIWEDGKEHTYPLNFLRDESPDAGNKGETILWTHYPPPPKGPDKPGKYQIASIQKVGGYAIQIFWKDGASDGIYSWDLLRNWGEQMEKNLKEEEEKGQKGGT